MFLEERNEDLGTTACPLTAFSALGPEGEGAAARRANGDSALLVAWDLPDGPGRYGSGDYYAHCGRGAFGTSLWRQEEFFQKGWNPTLRFDDDSSVWIFPELSMDLPADRIVHLDPQTGALAPEAYLALIETADHPDCLYRGWSSYGPEHVEYLVSRLRYVEDWTAGRNRPEPEPTRSRATPPTSPPRCLNARISGGAAHRDVGVHRRTRFIP